MCPVRDRPPQPEAAHSPHYHAFASARLRSFIQKEPGSRPRQLVFYGLKCSFEGSFNEDEHCVQTRFQRRTRPCFKARGRRAVALRKHIECTVKGEPDDGTEDS